MRYILIAIITYLALYMKDFTHMNENKKFVEGLINFSKIRNMHKVVSLIYQYNRAVATGQVVRYNLTTLHLLTTALNICLYVYR